MGVSNTYKILKLTSRKLIVDLEQVNDIFQSSDGTFQTSFMFSISN